MKILVSRARNRGIQRFGKQIVAVTAAVILIVCVALIQSFYAGRDAGPVVATGAEILDDETEGNSNDVSEASAVSAVINTLENFGAASPEEAVSIWADGVCGRNGITQYSVMTSDLKEKYLGVITENYSSMVFPTTEESVDGWFVEDVFEDENGKVVAKIRFTISSAEGSENAMAELQLVNEDGFVAVSSVAVESPLYGFTGLKIQ